MLLFGLPSTGLVAASVKDVVHQGFVIVSCMSDSLY